MDDGRRILRGALGGRGRNKGELRGAQRRRTTADSDMWVAGSGQRLVVGWREGEGRVKGRESHRQCALSERERVEGEERLGRMRLGGLGRLGRPSWKASGQPEGDTEGLQRRGAAGRRSRSRRAGGGGPAGRAGELGVCVRRAWMRVLWRRERQAEHSQAGRRTLTLELELDAEQWTRTPHRLGAGQRANEPTGQSRQQQRTAGQRAAGQRTSGAGDGGRAGAGLQMDSGLLRQKQKPSIRGRRPLPARPAQSASP